jgi:hypothetical protein
MNVVPNTKYEALINLLENAEVPTKE